MNRFSEIFFENPRYSSLLAKLAWGCCALSGFLFVVGPTSHFRAFLGDAERYLGFSQFILLFGAAVFASLSGILRVPKERTAPTRPLVARSRKLTVFQVVVSLVVLGQTVRQITLPFDLDENQRAAAAITKSFWHEINPFRHTEVHAVAHVFAIASMKVFGENKIAYRLPSIIFAVLFLVMLNAIANRFLQPFTRLLLFSHLLVNEMVIWYLHSTRGYVSALFVTSVLLFILLELGVQGVPRKSSQRIWVFSVFFALSVLTHPFTGIYSLLLLSSFAFWAYLKRHEMDRALARYCWQLILAASIWLPLFFAVFVCVLRSLEPIANLHHGGFENFVLKVLTTLPSLGRLWALKLIGLAILYAGAAQWVRHKRLSIDLLGIFFVTVFVFYGAVLTLLRVSHLEPRWFVPFIIPMVLAFGEWLSRSRGPAYAAVLAGVYLLLTVLPFRMQHGILDTLGVLYHQPYESFLAEVRQKTGPVRENCYQFPDKSMGAWAQTFHFSDAPRNLLEKSDCRHFYLISLDEAPLDPPANARLVFHSQFGEHNAVYQLTN
ncbi:MAG: hypothetical protein H6617_08055 [Bdellovibrionaceae bacterium]|nr:hypothetical protein [Bdellovibrionales bacterium]MCB9254618.1 hypothetical protein [Pseudobdellovibrionaceae bacterium]